MKPDHSALPLHAKSLSCVLSVFTLTLVVLLAAGCGGSTGSANPTSTAIAASIGSGSSKPAPTTASSSSSSSSSGSAENAPNAVPSKPLVAADGTLKTAMQRVNEAEGMKFSLAYTNTTGTPQLDFGFKIEGVTSGRLLPNRMADFTLTMTYGGKGAKQNGEWIFYWSTDQIISYFKNGGQWQELKATDLSSDPTNFDPTYAYNELGELTTFGTTSMTGDSSLDLLTEMANSYTLAGTEQVNGETADRYHREGAGGGTLDLWVSKKSGDIIKFQRDVTANGLGTLAVLMLSDIGKPETIQLPK